MDFKTMDFREFHDTKTKKVIKVVVKYYTKDRITVKSVERWKGIYSPLLENFFNYPENKNIFDNLKEGHEIEVSLNTITDDK